MFELIDKLKCPICLQPPKLQHVTESLQCPAGHIVCNKCKMNLSIISCPMCRSKMTNITSFIIIMAKILLQDYKYECQWFGCNLQLIESEITIHEQNCKFKMIVCPWPRCTASEILEKHIYNRIPHNVHLRYCETDSIETGWDFPVSLHAFLNVKHNVIPDHNEFTFPRLLLLNNYDGSINRNFKLFCLFIFQQFKNNDGSFENTICISLQWADKDKSLMSQNELQYLDNYYTITLYDYVYCGLNIILTDSVKPLFKYDNNPYNFYSGTNVFAEHMIDTHKRNRKLKVFCRKCEETMSHLPHFPHFHITIKKQLNQN